MIKEEELLEAIAECQGVRSPNANTCLKLASYYTILDHIKKGEEVKGMPMIPDYSYASGPAYRSETEFGKMISKLETNKTLKIIDELMTTLQVVNPRLYMSVLRKLESNE